MLIQYFRSSVHKILQYLSFTFRIWTQFYPDFSCSIAKQKQKKSSNNYWLCQKIQHYFLNKLTLGNDKTQQAETWHRPVSQLAITLPRLQVRNLTFYMNFTRILLVIRYKVDNDETIHTNENMQTNNKLAKIPLHYNSVICQKLRILKQI